MKKVITFLVIGMLVAAVSPGAAIAGKKKAKPKPPVRQEVSGHIALQAPPADATSDPNGCFAGVHRRIAVFTQEAVNGVVGHHFEIDAKTWKMPFRLTPTSAVDIDIYFYSEFGTIEQATDTSYAPTAHQFQERDNEGEFGIVPPDTTRAIVCMKTGNNAGYDYVAGTGVK
ncbi:MAG TPA: hypothetical protein VG929_01350 [Actinomycetota bacterium]|nr:hypothetical protein [Actinomycetota bacterium]